MSKHEKSWKPGYRPVQKIELSTKNLPLRAFLLGLCVLIAVIGLGVGFSDLFSTKPGWQEIEADVEGPSYSGEFSFSYDFSELGSTATAAYKKISALYTQAHGDAYRIFDEDVAMLGSSPNEVITVDEALYDALALMEEMGSRYLYLAPVYVEYNRIFSSESEVEAAQFDPVKNEALIPYLESCAAFANDPEMIRLELLGDNQVRMAVNSEYLAFADEHEIVQFLDFSWMRNAFICDYLADVMVAEGYTSGVIASQDGFTRNLDDRGTEYGFNIFDRLGNALNKPAVLYYDQPLSIVFLRDYAMSNQENHRYYEYADGTFASSFVDPADGMRKTAIDTLVSYSHDAGCAEILLQMAPVFIAESFLEDGLGDDLAPEGIFVIWCDENMLICTEPQANVIMDPDSGYSLVRVYENNWG